MQCGYNFFRGKERGSKVEGRYPVPFSNLFRWKEKTLQLYWNEKINRQSGFEKFFYNNFIIMFLKMIEYLQCWSRSTNSFYVGALLSGRKFITPYPDIEDDPLQMGGDILINSKGQIINRHLSKFPADRQNPEIFMDCIKKCRG